MKTDMYVNLPCYSFHLHYITLYSQLPEIAVHIHICMCIYITHIFFSTSLQATYLLYKTKEALRSLLASLFVEQLLEMHDTYSSHPNSNGTEFFNKRCYANHET